MTDLASLSLDDLRKHLRTTRPGSQQSLEAVEELCSRARQTREATEKAINEVNTQLNVCRRLQNDALIDLILKGSDNLRLAISAAQVLAERTAAKDQSLTEFFQSYPQP